MEQTGGIFYHYLALRNSLRYWRNYQGSIETFLSEALSCDKKLLVGPSGGYSLSKSHFSQITNKDIIAELDPVARLILKSKLKQNPQWIKHDLFKIGDEPEESASFSAGEFKRLGVERIVFCNMLGQLAYQYPGHSEQFWKNFLSKSLKKLQLDVYSYHDRWSILASKDYLDSFEENFKSLNLSEKMGLKIKDFCEHTTMKKSAQQKVEILDHPTDIFDSMDCRFHAIYPWRRTKNCLHLIHCISLTNL